jgi:hypothetical protein
VTLVADGQTVAVSDTSLEPTTRFYFFISFNRQFLCPPFGAPSLTRGRLRNLLSNRSMVGSHRTYTHVLLSDLRLMFPFRRLSRLLWTIPLLHGIVEVIGCLNTSKYIGKWRKVEEWTSATIRLSMGRNESAGL